MRLLPSYASLLLGMALLAPVSQAQLPGTTGNDSAQHSARPATVMPARGAHPGVMPTPMGVSPAPAPAFPTPTPIGVPPLLPTPGANNTGFHHHHHDNFVGGTYPVYVPVPAVVDPYSMYPPGPDQADQQTDDQAVVSGPTVFERRTPDEMSLETSDPGLEGTQPASSADDSSAAANSVAAGTQTAEPQEPSVLVFNDGHQLEVQNYAIVSDFLYDFTPGHMHKVPLSQLDLPATVKANDERGVDFTLPASAKGN